MAWGYPVADEKLYTQADLDRRLEEARNAATFKAWKHMLELFDVKQRRHLANMMAHSAKIGAIELVRRDWPQPERIVAAHGVDAPLAGQRREGGE